jgi:hypothetical protein
MVRKFNDVDVSFARINRSVERITKKSYAMTCGLFFGSFLLVFRAIQVESRMHMEMFGEWPELLMIVAHHAHLLYKITALMHTWIILFEAKRRLSTLQHVLESLIKK